MREKKGILLGYFIGEGSFSISFSKNDTSKYGLQVSREISVGSKDKQMLKQLQETYGGAFVQKEARGEYWRWYLRDLKEQTKFINDFLSMDVRTKHKKKARLFRQAINLIKQKDHFYYTKEDLIKLARIGEKITDLGAGKKKWTVNKVREFLEEYSGSGKKSYWTEEEEEKLRKYYPTASWDKLLRLLPKRTKHTIVTKAYRMGIKRKWEAKKTEKVSRDSETGRFKPVEECDSLE